MIFQILARMKADFEKKKKEEKEREEEKQRKLAEHYKYVGPFAIYLNFYIVLWKNNIYHH